MASKPKRLHQDPRWPEFCRAFAGDLVRFAIDVAGITPTHQQIQLFAEVAPSRSMVSVASGHGCFAAGTQVMRENGQAVAVEDVVVGDRLMGDDGASARTVLELKRGRERMYRFTYMDGSSHVFNESHILCLVATNSKGRRVTGQKTTVTVREWLTWGEDRKRCHAIYRSKVESFAREEKRFPIPPYILGVWLGDGSSNIAVVTTEDAEIVRELQAYAAAAGLKLKKLDQNRTGRADMWHFSAASGWKNPMNKALRDIGVFNNKHVPDDYLYAPLQDRLDLLAGLIDTDGSYDKGSSGYDIVQKNERLASNIFFLARSVGCHATIKKVTKRCCNNGKYGEYFRVSIGRNTAVIPVRIERKRRPAGLHSQRKNLNFGIRSVDPLGEDDYYGFTLDGNSQFLGADFTVLHNTGKTLSLAVIVLWHLTCFPQSVTLLTANDMDQLKATLWKEIGLARERIRRGAYGWLAEHINIMADGTAHIAGFKDTWFVESKTANEKTANKLAGRHGEWLLIVADEASSLPDGVLTTLRGALTEQHNRMLMTSQATRNAGFFYRSHHDLSALNGGDWTSLRFSSLDSPLVSDQAIREMMASYDEDERRVRLYGLFPEESGKHMQTLAVSESMYRRGRIIRDDEAYGWLVLGDIASGEGLRDKSAVVIARVIGWSDMGDDARRVEVVEVPLLTNKIRSNVFAGAIHEQGDPLDGVTYVVDSGGLGINVCQDLEDRGCVVTRVNWGNPCFARRNRDRYLNLRAQATHQAARAAKEGRLSILTFAHKNAMLTQSSRIPKTFTDKGRLRVPPKHSREWDGMPSPDLWDAVCFAFLESVQYVAADHRGGASTPADRALQQAEALFADVA